MEVKEIRRLLDAMAGSDVSELVLETGDYKLTVKRGSQQHQQAVVGVPATAPLAPQPNEQASAGQPQSQTTPAAEQTESSNLVEVQAPIVGTFYSAPSPDADDYVKVGDRVERGTVLCIIEAMKLMNEIEAEIAGVIKEILVRNEEPVEYGQVLFRIEPS